MKKYISKTVFLLVLMTCWLWSFGQEEKDMPGETKSISVSILKNSCLCPPSGYVSSLWYWTKPNNPTKQISGTGFAYSAIPWYAMVYGTGPSSGYIPASITLYINPTGGLGASYTSVPYASPYSAVLRAGSCVPSGTHYNCPLDSD